LISSSPTVGVIYVVGLLVTARLDSATPKAGLSYGLDSIAAVVIGGTSLNGRRGSISPGARLFNYWRVEQRTRVMRGIPIESASH